MKGITCDHFALVGELCYVRGKIERGVGRNDDLVAVDAVFINDRHFGACCRDNFLLYFPSWLIAKGKLLLLVF
ncbi:hypothetical protein U1Q18_035342 [Sarracenia purpurea var. burkii]